MRALILVLALCATAFAGETPFKPFDGTRESVASLSKEAGKPVLVALLHDGCEPSVEMERYVLADPAVASALRESFVPVAVRNPDAATCARFGFPEGGTPSFILFGADGKEIDRDFYSNSKDEFLWTIDLWKGGRTVDVLRKAVAERPGDADANFVLGKRLARRQEKGALEFVRCAVELAGAAPRPWSVEARWLLLDERSDGDVYSDLLAFAREHVDTRFASSAHWKLTRYRSSTAQIRQAMASFEILRTRGRLGWFETDYARLLAFEGGDAKLGLEFIDRWLQRAPNDASFHDIRAECLERLGRTADAVAAAERAVECSRDEGDRREFRRALRERRKRQTAEGSAK